MLDWLLTPLTHYVALAIGLTACLALFVSAKLEIQRIRRQALRSGTTLDEQVRGLSEQMQAMRENLQKVDAAPAVAPPLLQSINLSRRTQALRMHRRGEPAHSIAPALGVPRNEIELLLKVHGIVKAQNSNPGSVSAAATGA